MKAVAQLFSCALALGTLLAGAASHATNVSELPLRAAVLAKPNVVIAFDDSGSMDFEVLLSTNDGAFWWDYSSASGWDASGKPWYNSAGDPTATWRKMAYLFPNGTASGQRVLADGSYDHFAVPPTSQFAFLRSSSYNPTYYNPAVTYKPWSPAYVGGVKKTYANATPTAALSHPVLGGGSFDLTATRALATTTDNTFMALPGMVVPAGSKTCPASACSSWTTEAANRTVPASTMLRLAMAYFPATYYKKETCTVAADGSCVSAPDGATLKRYEIKAANYASAAAYNAELQNFANWFQYYRKRRLFVLAAMGGVLEPLTGLRMGVVKFNNRTAVTMYDIDSTSDATNGLKVAGVMYEAAIGGGTPTRETLKYIGDQFTTNTGIIQYACQRNNAFVVTDGFAYANVTTPPSYSSATWGSGAPYQTTYAGTLADIALSYYTNNPRPALATGRVPTRTGDANTNLHVNTYALTLGAKGTLYIDESTAVPTSTGAWPNPSVSRNPTAVDDLWHATINGRGKMYMATTSEETAKKIEAGFNDILGTSGAQSGVAVSTVNLLRGDSRAYFGIYNPAGWQGDVRANAINTATGVISSTAAWSASTKLSARAWTDRVIASSNGTSGVGFTEAAVGSLVNPGGVWGTTSQVMNYLRGERTHEGTLFRLRTGLIGAIINSEPFISSAEGVLYVASGEGMLHAFDIRDPDAGKELWAFVPRAVLPDIGATVERGYAFKTQLDGSPVVAAIDGGKKLLVAGMGAAGRSFYALDVTTPRGLSESDLAGKVKWEFPVAGDSATAAKVGQSMGRPVITRTASDGYVVLVTSGYNNTADGKGRLWMLNANTGAVIKEFTVADGSLATESGLTHVTAFDEGEGIARYAYGGDLLGNVWRFDLRDKTAPNKVAVLTGPAGDLQPVTAAPEVTEINDQRVIVVGTGRLLDVTDWGSTKVQSLYVFKDGAEMSGATSPRATLVKQTFTRGTPDTITGASVDWLTQRGWYMDLPAGEQVNTRPSITYGGVAFVSNVAGGNDCSASSYMYLVDVKSGQKFAGASFISATISTVENATSVTNVVTSDGKARGLVQTYCDGACGGGGAGTPPGGPWSPPPPKTGKSAWREIRRQ